MKRKPESIVGFFTIVGALLLSPMMLQAQDDDAPPAAPAVVASPKLAIELGAPFRDNAVLQRDMKLPVWGWSKSGTTVTVEFAGQKKSTTAGKDGKWMLELDPLTASYEPAEMKIAESTGKAVTLKNLLVGEVWFASGQSNMVWVAKKCDVRLLQEQIAARVAEGKEKQPVIREAQITDYFAALHPVEHANAQWHSDAAEMSGIAYSFAYHVFKEIDVPVGILNCSFSQTPIQAWTPRIGFRDGKDEYTKALYQKVLETDPTTPEHKAAWEKFYADAEAAVKAGKAVSTKTPGNMGDNRDASWLFNARLNPMIPYACRGGIWNQGWANIGEGIVYYNNLHSMIRGWRLAWDKPDMPVYFNQFYANVVSETPSIGGAADMRFGTWLARDIPHTGMAIQIDIGGAIHYFNKTLSGQRLALHALKNEYGKKVVTDGPMFKSCKVEGDMVVIELDHAEGGLLVAETNTNSKAGLAVPTVIPDGAAQVKLFYLAGEDRVWYPAQVKIDGSKLVVSSPKVKAPRGVSYGSGGIGGKPNIYNQAMLPLAPFTYYDQEFVTAATWKGEFKVDGVETAPTGILEECRKMPLLSSQFVDNAVLQADQPVTIWGSTLPAAPWSDKPVDGKAEIKFSFAGVEKTIPVTPDMKEWKVTLPPQKASAEPKTLKVTFFVNGELAHERVCNNVVFGDVWYVAAPYGTFDAPTVKPSGVVRMMDRSAKGDRSNRPRPYTVSTSTTPGNKYASSWKDAEGFPAALGQAIAAKTGKPVGIIFMQSAGGKGNPEAALKHWIAAEDLGRAPSLHEDFEQLGSMFPGTKPYANNVQRYVNEWKKYWSEYIPALMATKAVPDRAGWGSFPNLAGLVTTDASQVYNVLVDSYTPADLKGIIFMSGKIMVEADQGAHFGEQLTALANSWKEKFACPDPVFLYTVPGASLAPKITKPEGIKGRSVAMEITSWPPEKQVGKDIKPVLDTVTAPLIEKVLTEAYK
jgi:sialate O-acetylesterase